MASRVGVIFAEVDLSYEPYTRAQKRLLKDATTTTLNIEKNFKDLGIKSAKEFDLMRAKVENAYNRIKSSSKVTSDDIVRAEKARANQLKRIHEQQFGHHESLLTKFKNNWLLASAAIYAGFRTIRKGFDLVLDVYGEFEVSLNRLGNVSNDTLGKMKDQIMGLSPELGRLNDLTKGYYQVLSAGVTDPVKSIELLTTSSKMAKESAIEQSESVKGLAAVMSSYSDELKTATDAADLLYYIERQGITAVGEIIPLIGNLANMSKAVGLSANEMGAALAQITTTGAGTSESVTQLQSLLTNLNKKFDMLPPSIKKYGATIDAIKALGFQGVLKEIWEYTDGNATALTKMLGRQEAYLALLQLSKNEFTDYSSKLDEMGNKGGAFQDSWERYSNTLKASIEELTSVMERVLFPALETWAGWIKNMATYYADLFNVAGRKETTIIDTFNQKIKDQETAIEKVRKRIGYLKDQYDKTWFSKKTYTAAIEEQTIELKKLESQLDNTKKAKERFESIELNKRIDMSLNEAFEGIDNTKVTKNIEDDWYSQIEEMDKQIKKVDSSLTTFFGDIDKEQNRLQDIDKSLTKAISDYFNEIDNAEKNVKSKRLESQKAFNLSYEELGLKRYDMERLQIERQAELWRQSGADRVKVEEYVQKKLTEINKAESKQRLTDIQSTTGMMADNFKSIAEMGGKYSSTAFKMYKAFKITETIISTYSGAIKAYEAMASIPYIGPALGAAAAASVVAFGMAQVAAIKSAQPPSYDQGGISNARGIYQTGNIPEAHIPLNRGAIPVKINDGGKRPEVHNHYHVEGNTFLDQDKMNQTFVQLAKIVMHNNFDAEFQYNYGNDMSSRRLIRSRP